MIKSFFQKLTSLQSRHKAEFYLFKMFIFLVRFFGMGVFKVAITIIFVILMPFLWQKLYKRYLLAKYNLSIIGDNNPSAIKMYLAMLKYVESFILFTTYGHKLLGTNSRFNLIQQGTEHIETLQKQGKGFIVVSFHYGNWEVFPTYLKSKFNIDNYFVYKEQKNFLIDEEVKKTRSGLEGVLPMKKGAKDIAEIKNITARGEAVDILIDQIQNIGSEPINLFGRQVKIGFAIQKLAVKYGIIIVPTFCFVDKNIDSKRYKIIFHKPIECTAVAKDQINPEAQKLTQQIANLAMQHIKQDPYQWFCLFYKIFGEPPVGFR